MASRKYNISNMTEEQLTALAQKFPIAVQTVTTRKPVYHIIAKLMDCGIPVEGVEIVEVPPFVKGVKA